MRVAIDVTPLAGDQTGIGIFVDELIAGLTSPTSQALLRESGQDPLHIVGLGLTARGRAEIAAALPSSVKLSRPAPARILRELWRRFDLPPVEILTGAIDLVHGTNYVVPPTHKAQALVTIADLGAWHTPEVVHPSSLMYPELVGRALKRGAHVHAMSSYVAQEIEAELGVGPDRIHTIPIGLRPLPLGDAERGRELAGLRPYLLAVGTIEPRKDFPLLARALGEVRSSHPDLQLVIAGGDGWGTRDLDQAIATNNLRGHVLKMGFVDDATKADLFAGSELVVSAARYEGFGLVPLEAMAAGRPVVAVAGGSIPEVCGSAARLVAVGDLPALVAALTVVLEDETVRQGLIDEGRRQVERFTWERTTREISELYRQLTR